eukprot:4814202-Pleurochrysis_carterae.AAC.1
MSRWPLSGSACSQGHTLSFVRAKARASAWAGEAAGRDEILKSLSLASTSPGAVLARACANGQA